MSKMDKTSVLRKKTTPDLRSLSLHLAQQRLGLRLQAAAGELKTPVLMRQVRRQRARVLTILREGKK